MKKISTIIVVGLILAFIAVPFGMAADYISGTVYRIEQDTNGTFVHIERTSDGKIAAYYIATDADVNKTLALLLTAQAAGDTVVGWPVGGVWTKFRVQF